MILTENQSVLASKFPATLKVVQQVEDQSSDLFDIKVVPSKNGFPTLIVTRNAITTYVHSKYDPLHEAGKLVGSFQNVDKYRHVIFYGLGMGYHIEEFMKRYPRLDFTIFEPSPQILREYLANRPLQNLPLRSLKYLVTENTFPNIKRFFSEFIDNLHGEVLFFPLPSYERLFKEEYQQFVADFTKMINSKRADMTTSLVYQKKWTFNCIRNLPYVLNTPSFLQSARESFRGKPAVIVAAGPSVMDDLENLRHIKEHGLAYIFAAGSGLIPMLNAGIVPDAIVSYDPNINDCVIEPVIKNNIASLPLIFGSTVGFNKLEKYPGPKLHFLLNQDSLAPFYLKNINGEPLRYVHDQPTISGVILQLLYILGCNPIVFTGQNLGFRGNLSYAPGISYYNPDLTEDKLKGAFLTEDVYGGQIYTNESYQAMRESLEIMIAFCEGRQIYNSTKGGAKIGGAPFVPLEELIGHWTASVVSDNWSKETSLVYDREYFQKQHRIMEAEYHTLKKVFTQLQRMIGDFPDVKIKGNRIQVNTALIELNKKFKRMTSNLFFECYILPQKRVELEVFAKKIAENDSEPDETVRVAQLHQLMAQFILQCKTVFDVVEPLYHQLQDIINGSGC